MQKIIHRQFFSIRGYDVDVDMEASTISIIRILHDAAVDQVLEMGFSALQLTPRNLAWVLAHQHLEIFRPPKLGDTIEVLTYPSGLERAFTYRDYYMFDQQQSLLAQATTTWILMDTIHRKISPYPEDIRCVLQGTEKLKHLPRAQQARINPAARKFLLSCRPGYFEQDFNGHVSNHYFFKWMLDPLSIDFFRTHQLVDFNVKIKGEAFAGEEIDVGIQSETPETISHWLVKGSETIATGISHWIKKHRA